MPVIRPMQSRSVFVPANDGVDGDEFLAVCIELDTGITAAIRSSKAVSTPPTIYEYNTPCEK